MNKIKKPLFQNLKKKFTEKAKDIPKCSENKVKKRNDSYLYTRSESTDSDYLAEEMLNRDKTYDREGNILKVSRSVDQKEKINNHSQLNVEKDEKNIKSNNEK
jgi:hypothetical protein